MITGYNTDVEFGGVIYHIQTEDKGLATPIILSLVYDRGTILAAKREPYDDLVEQGFDENLLIERLTKQHKIICAAVKKGRIEDLKVLTQQKRNGKVAQPAVEPIAPAVDEKFFEPAVVDINGNGAPALEDGQPIIDVPSDPFETVVSPIPMPRTPAIVLPKKAAATSEFNVPIVDDVAVIEIAEPLPFDAVHVVSDLAGIDRPDNNKLSLDFIGDDVFCGGTRAYVTIMVCRGASRKVVADAEVMVKVLGSSFRPLIFHSQTDKNGISTVVLEIPTFHSGRASILVRAISNGEEVEVRRPIIHG